jgi:hypothetical protein
VCLCKQGTVNRAYRGLSQRKSEQYRQKIGGGGADDVGKKLCMGSHEEVRAQQLQAMKLRLRRRESLGRTPKGAPQCETGSSGKERLPRVCFLHRPRFPASKTACFQGTKSQETVNWNSTSFWGATQFTDTSEGHTVSLFRVEERQQCLLLRLALLT